jgi:hypothetical protein
MSCMVWSGSRWKKSKYVPWSTFYYKANAPKSGKRPPVRFFRYLLVLTILPMAIAGVSNADQGPVVQFLGLGSSALFMELGQAAQSAATTSTPCLWTQTKDPTILARDNRFVPSTIDEQGSIWVTWSPGSTGTCAAPAGTGINVYAYMSLDSVLGNRCFFGVDSSLVPGCTHIMQISAGTGGANLLCSPSPSNCTSFGPDTPIPQVIINALHTQHFFCRRDRHSPRGCRLRRSAHVDSLWRAYVPPAV